MNVDIIENKAGRTNKKTSQILQNMIQQEKFVDCIGDPSLMGWFAFFVVGDDFYIVTCYDDGDCRYQRFTDKFDAGFAWLGIQNMYAGLEEL